MPIRGVQTFEKVGSGVVRLGDTVVPERAVWGIQGRDGSPSVSVEFEIRDGIPMCVSVRCEATPDGRGVQTGDLTTLPSLGRLAEEVFAELSSGTMSASEDAALEGLDVKDRIRAKTRAQFAAAVDRDARRSALSDIRGDAVLREVARVYRENLSEHPTEAVQDFLSSLGRGGPRRGVSRSTASRRIEEARARGYLPTTTRGRKNA